MEPIDNCVWHALTGPQESFAEGAPAALRYPPDVAVFVALPDEIAEDHWSALADLVGPGGAAVLFRSEVPEAPTAWAETMRLDGVQMIGPAPGEAIAAPVAEVPIEALTTDDVPAMVELVELTQPGPFEQRTIELGTYVGVRHEGELVAMAGQRVRMPGYTEISAVRTHPDHQGRGLAGALVAAVVAEIHGRADTPFLHATSTNDVAISRYRSLGFAVRRTIQAAAFTAPG